MVPNKTIYVADDDLPLFERAQALAGGSLSAAVANALRSFVEVREAQGAGLEEVTVGVGPAGSRRKKRFFGVRLIRWAHRLQDGRKEEVFSVYRTRGGRFAVHRQVRPNWGAMSDPAWWMDVENWKGLDPRGRDADGSGEWYRGGEASLEVYESIAELEQHVPPELFARLERGGDEPPLEDLDI